jgi:hypothetical protein
VAWDAAGNIFVADGYGNARIAKLDKNGRFLKSWGVKGAEPGQFDTPHSLATDAAGKVYVADLGNKRIQVFDNEGVFQTQISNVGAPWAICISPPLVPVQLQLQQSSQYGQWADLQAGIGRARPREVRQSRQASQGIRHGQPDRLP